MARPALRSRFDWSDCRARLAQQRWNIAICLCLFLLAAPVARAGNFSVNPIRVELSASQTSAVIHVDNQGDSTVTVEARTLAWSQSKGKDQLASTRDIIVTPQIFRLKPGASQVLRIGALRKPDATQELSYRLMLEEIPAPPAPDFKGLQVALRISLPVFLKPRADAKEKVDVALSLNPDRQLRLNLSNSGNAAAHFSEIALFSEDDTDKLIAGLTASTYVLPGQQRELLLKPASFDTDKKILIKARTTAGPVEFHAVPVSR